MTRTGTSRTKSQKYADEVNLSMFGDNKPHLFVHKDVPPNVIYFVDTKQMRLVGGFMEYETKDSGHKRTFETGAQRDRPVGKGRYDLISPLSMERLAGVFERGAIKYDPRNWEKGMPLSNFIDSALRHTFQLLEGRLDEDHAAQAAWNLLSYIHTEEMIRRGLLPRKLNDMPNFCVTTELVEGEEE